MKQYSAVVISAGYAGVGYALCNDNVLVLEKGEMPGSDFHSVLRPSEKLSQSHTDKGREFLAFLSNNSLIHGEFVDIFQMSLALCKYIQNQDKKPEILLDVQLVEVIQKDRYFEIEYRTNSGIHTVIADRVIDTSFAFDSARENVFIQKKLLHVHMSNMPDGYEESILKVYSDVKFHNGFYENEATASFEFPVDCEIFEARQTIEDCFEKAFNDEHPVIDMISFEFDIVASPLKNDDIIWLPPHTFSNPIAAFDAGCDLRA